MRKGFMAKVVVATTVPLAASGLAYAAGTFHEVKPHSYDPAHTFLVTSGWINGVGCPTNAKTSSGTYTDPACDTGSSIKDDHNQGLILSKVGPTSNNAAAQVDLKDVAGTHVTELGYDIRKHGGAASPTGSHCGGGAPRFNVTYADDPSAPVFLGCNAADSETPGDGWTRLRWNLDGTRTVKSIQIVFDEGTDAAGGTDQFGLAVLDNIDVDGVLVGHGDNGDAA